VETPSTRYDERTEWNVRDSDGTVVFTFAHELTGGSLATVEFCGKYMRPCIHISRASYTPALDLQHFVRDHAIEILNVAGSRESRDPGIWLWVYEVIEDALFWSQAHPGMLGGPGEG
jgi:hypothetical protein